MFKRSVSIFAALLVAGISSVAFAGDTRGPRFAKDRVLHADSAHTYTFNFERKEIASVYLSGSGSSDLDCFLYDENGGLIDSDTDATDTCLVRATPLWEGKFSFIVRNVGDKVSVYSLHTN